MITPVRTVFASVADLRGTEVCKRVPVILYHNDEDLVWKMLPGSSATVGPVTGVGRCLALFSQETGGEAVLTQNLGELAFPGDGVILSDDLLPKAA